MHNIHRPTEPKKGLGAHIGERISFGKRKDAGEGYMSRSERVGPSVLVLHDFFGLTGAVTQFADELNAEGFTVLAPDFYDGRLADSVEEATAMVKALDFEKAMARLGGAASFLTDNWHPRLGLVGFSLGAGLALEFVQQRDAEAAVIYYGLNNVDPDKLRSPLLGHFAELDDWEPLDDVRSIFDPVIEVKEDVEVHIYEGAGHWFANPSVPDAYLPEAAGLAWSRTVDFLRHHLA
jgi:carboxymethylenebutenolidase